MTLSCHHARMSLLNVEENPSNSNLHHIPCLVQCCNVVLEKENFNSTPEPSSSPPPRLPRVSGRGTRCSTPAKPTVQPGRRSTSCCPCATHTSCHWWACVPAPWPWCWSWHPRGPWISASSITSGREPGCHSPPCRLLCCRSVLAVWDS